MHKYRKRSEKTERENEEKQMAYYKRMNIPKEHYDHSSLYNSGNHMQSQNDDDNDNEYDNFEMSTVGPGDYFKEKINNFNTNFDNKMKMLKMQHDTLTDRYRPFTGKRNTQTQLIGVPVGKEIFRPPPPPRQQQQQQSYKNSSSNNQMQSSSYYYYDEEDNGSF